MKKLGIGAAALVLGLAVGFAPSAHASTVLDVTWSGESKSLGTLTGAGSGADFYDYGGGTTNAPISLDLATAYAFLHESTTTGELSFGMIFTGSNITNVSQVCGLPNGDPELCRTNFQGYLSGADAGSTVSVKDDKANIFGDTDRSALGANGFYALLPFTGTTDGFVVDGIQAGDELVMDETRFDNFENIVFISGTEGSPIFTEFDLTAPDADLRISFGLPTVTTFINQPAAVPLPAGGVLLLSALGLAGGLRARKKAA